jgi:UDP-N-acetylglucosamine--N-acetylmuramyl-(pentapeptide) pyrophosphoryl-undecaprenol N-acetylglucosamine transferase
LTCGGTAGHINPAIAVAQRLRELSPDCEILFIGAEGKMEMDLVPRDGFRILPLKVTNLSRGHHLEDIGHNLNSLKNVIESGREAKRILKEFRPDAVLGTGGYVCYPVLHEAAKLHIPTLIHESNATPGLTTKMLAGQVSCVMLGYQESAGHYSGTADLRVTGTPVRGRFSLYTREKAREELGIPADLPLVVSMWGSLGSGHMNDIVMKMLPLMKGQQDFCMIHATGSYYHDAVTEKLKAAGQERYVTYVKAYEDLDKAGFEQVPTGSNWSYDTNFAGTVNYCLKVCSADRLKGFMMAPWFFTLPGWEKKLLEGIDQVGAVIKTVGEGVTA